MKIQVLGSGCPTCRKLYELTQEAVNQLKVDEKVEYVTDVSKIVEMGVMSSPVLAVDGKPIMVGFVPHVGVIKDAIKQTMDDKRGDCCVSPECEHEDDCC